MSSRPVSDIRNVLLNWGAFLVAAIAGLYLSPRLVRALGHEGYAVWALVGALVGPLSLLDLGVRSAVTRLVAQAHARGDLARTNQVVSTARVMYLAAGALAVVIAGVFAIGVSAWFTVPPGLIVPARIVLLAVGVSLALSLSTGLYSGVLAAVRRLDVLGTMGIVLELARVALVLAVLFMGGGLIWLGLVTLAIAIGRYHWQRSATHTIYPGIHPRLTRPRRDDVRAIVDISVFSTVIYGLATITSQVNTYVIGATLPLAMVTFFAIGATLPIYVQSLSLPIAQNLLPRASQLQASGREAEVGPLVLNTSRLGALAILPVIIGFLTRGRTFLGIWMGPEFMTTSGDVLAILAVGGSVGLVRHVIQTVFVGTGTHRALVPWYLGEAALTVALSVLFVPAWGIVGAAWAATIPGLLLVLGILPILLGRRFRVRVLALWLQVWIRPAAALLPFAVALWFSDRSWPASTYPQFFLQIALVLPIAVVGIVGVGLNAGERGVVLAKFRAWRMAAAKPPGGS